MQQADPPNWTFDDHMRKGAQAVSAIQLVDAEQLQPVCHHFTELDPVDETAVSRYEAYGHLEPVFAEAGVQFLSDRLEAWEVIRPNQDWLAERIPHCLQTAANHGLNYEGWSWEPPEMQPISACSLVIINNRTS